MTIKTGSAQKVFAAKSGGKPTFPTLRLLDLLDSIDAECLSRKEQTHNSHQLEVGKVGLPPLFCVGGLDSYA